MGWTNINFQLKPWYRQSNGQYGLIGGNFEQFRFLNFLSINDHDDDCKYPPASHFSRIPASLGIKHSSQRSQLVYLHEWKFVKILMMVDRADTCKNLERLLTYFPWQAGGFTLTICPLPFAHISTW